MLQKIKNIFIFPVAFAYVMCFLFYYFIVLFIQGYHTYEVIQILYINMNGKLDKLIYRASWLTPAIYLLLILRLFIH